MLQFLTILVLSILLFYAFKEISVLVSSVKKQWNELLEAVKAIPHQFPPVPNPEVVVVRLPAKDAKKEVCKCGIPGCLGHEEIGTDGPIPYFTSEAVLAKAIQRGAKIIRFDREISHVEPGEKPSH